jgi:two-component system cell cycle sensor histidine kinase/response regulator CckA
MNLGSNASDAMPEGGRLGYQTENMTLDREAARRLFDAPLGKYVLLTVSDSGHGMDKTTQEHIFDPFYTQKEVGQGTGLGLSVVYGVVKSHHGFIVCDSKPEKGTIFRIYLPALDSPVKSEAGPASATRDMVVGGDEVILLVDDEASLRDLGREALSRYGYEILLASSGEEALEIYGQEKVIDLVILDVSMPGMGGGKCLLELLKINPEARIIISSGYSLDGPLQDILSSGASGFVSKPFSISNLLVAIRQVLDP